jgi:hypothetical protein
MKLTTVKELEVNEGVPHYRWIIKTVGGITMASTRTRKEARDLVRQTKNAVYPPQPK